MESQSSLKNLKDLLSDQETILKLIDVVATSSKLDSPEKRQNFFKLNSQLERYKSDFDFNVTQKEFAERVIADLKDNNKILKEFLDWLLLYDQKLKDEDREFLCELVHYDSLVPQPSTLVKSELRELLSILELIGDCTLEAKRALSESFNTVIRNFHDCSLGRSLDNLKQIIEFLNLYYTEELAIGFVQCMLNQIKKTNSAKNVADSNLEKLKEWRDRFAQKYNVQSKEVIHPSQKAYLLVSILEKAGYVNVWTELRIDTEEKSQPIDIDEDQRGFKCNFDECYKYLAELLQEVEYHIGKEVTLEFFLRLKFLNENLGGWEFQDELGGSISLENHRGFIVRSLDRVYNDKLKYQKVLQDRLQENWRILKKCLEEETVLRDLHELTQLGCGSGELRHLLQGKPGSKIMIPLPDDNEEQKQVLYEIIIAAIPIALWTCHVDCKPGEVSEAFEQILKKDCLISFADLATHIKILRVKHKSQPLLNLRILCDCPERLPTLNGRALTIPS